MITMTVTQKTDAGDIAMSLMTGVEAHPQNDGPTYTQVRNTPSGPTVAHKTVSPTDAKADWSFSEKHSVFTAMWEFTIAFNPIHGLSGEQAQAIVDEMNLAVAKRRNYLGQPIIFDGWKMVRLHGFNGNQAGLFNAACLHFASHMEAFAESGCLECMRVSLAEWTKG